MDYHSILFNDHYYSKLDLRFNNKYGLFFSNEKLIEYKKYKDELIDNGTQGMIDIPLKSFNSKHIFIVESPHLLTLLSLYNSAIVTNDDSSIIQKKKEDILTSRIFSEVEGTLLVENVPTTRTRIAQISKSENIENLNDRIVKNMIEGINFLLEKPSFDKENLYKLYNILSNGCLKESQKLSSNYYRNDMVYIGDYEGCPVEKIEDCMDSLFEFVNKSMKTNILTTYLPHICHYYILYVHPYFDFNGRIARMVSLWISLLINKEYSMPLFISEAINDNKRQYYEALSETRDMNNDLSYFIIYIANISIKYALTYKNVDCIEQDLLNKGITLTSQEKFYLKKILLHDKEGQFDYRRFIEFSNVDISKQAAFKILNKFNEEYGILFSVINDKKVKLFRLNQKAIQYCID